MPIVYDPITCYKNLLAAGKRPCPNDTGTGMSTHCGAFSVSPAVHQKCAEQQATVYTPVDYSEAYNKKKCGKEDPPVTNDYNPKKCDEQTFTDADALIGFLVDHPDFGHRVCYCCCACYAYGTPIATPAGEKVIEQFMIGDDVSAASIAPKGKSLGLSWGAKVVYFSSGTGPLRKGATHYPTMVFVHYGEDKSLIVTEDQLFLLSNGQLKQANALSVLDMLVNADGSPVRINAVKLGEYGGGLHHIATDIKFEGDINGHLLNSNGVVTGDYTLQIHAEQLGDRLATGPRIGTPDYEKAHGRHAVALFAYHHPDAPAEIALAQNMVLYTGKSAPIPPDARAFISEPQESEILSKLRPRPIADKAGADAVAYAFQLYKAFFPDIHFYLDWENIHPNAYAFREFGQEHVVLSGGLVRTPGIYEEGLGIIIAQAAAFFTKPVDDKVLVSQLLPRVQADYYGIGYIMRVAWGLNRSDLVEKGLDQIREFFGNITDNVTGDPENSLDDPSISCRLLTMQHAWLGGDLPECAGGPPPPPPALKANGATVGKLTEGKANVTVSFNEPVDTTSAEQIDNYATKPAAKLTAAKVNQDDPSSVTITGEFETKTGYQITVSNVASAKGAALDPDNSSVSFTTA
jgi:hypothetical protein